MSAAPASIRLRPLETAMAEPADDPHFIAADPADQLRPDFGRAEPVTFPATDGKACRAPVPAGHPQRGRTRTGGRAVRPDLGGQGTGRASLCRAARRRRLYLRHLRSRRFGESEGAPRYLYDPNDIIADFHAAARFLLSRDDVDPERVGALGVCMGGGYAVSLGAREKRLKAVVSVAGGYDIGGTFQRMMGPEKLGAYLASINTLVQQGLEDGDTRYVPTIAHTLDEATPIAAMPNEEAYSWYDRTSRDYAPTWSREIAAASFEPYFSYNAVAHAPLVAPTPLQIIHGSKDLFLLPEYAEATYAAAQGEKELVWIETDNHVELYDQRPFVDAAVAHALRWLDQHLKGGGG